MGYTDQKYYDRALDMIADSNTATGTYTASSTANTAIPLGPLPTFLHRVRVNALKAVVHVAPKTGLTTLSLMNGTTTIGTATVSSTASVGAELNFTMLNTASLSTATISNTRANGQVDVSTQTITTDWTIVGSATRLVLNAGGLSTASADTMGAYEIFAEAQEFFV